MNSNPPNRRSGKLFDRRAAILLIAALALPVLFGLAAIAVDLGMLYLLKAELQVAASAAAAGGALLLPSESDAATAAFQMAESNMAVERHGSVLDMADVEFGHWDEQSRVFSTAAGSGTINSVRITTRRSASKGNPPELLFGRLSGYLAPDLSASATAVQLPALLGALGAGDSGISVTGNVTTDSYDSTEGDYGPETSGTNGDIVTSGDVSISGSVTIQGDVTGGTVSIGGGSVTGETSIARRSVDYPSVDISAVEQENDNDNLPLIAEGNRLVSPLDAQGDFTLTGGVEYEIPPGVYLFRDFSLGGQSSVIVSGPTDIYLTGDLDTSGGDVINSTQNPNNLRIFMTGGTATINASVDWYGLLYAPDSTVSINGSADIYGAIVGDGIVAGGTGSIHFDEGLVLDGSGIELPHRSTLVQ